MRLMNEVLRPFLGRLMVVYFDDILVYSKSEEDYLHHLEEVFKVLRALASWRSVSSFHLKSPFWGMLSPRMVSPWIKQRSKPSSHGPLIPSSPKLGAFRLGNIL